MKRMILAVAGLVLIAGVAMTSHNTVSATPVAGAAVKTVSVSPASSSSLSAPEEGFRQSLGKFLFLLTHIRLGDAPQKSADASNNAQTPSDGTVLLSGDAYLQVSLQPASTP